MTDQNNQLTRVNPNAGDRGIVLRSMSDATEFAKAVAESGLAPPGMSKPEQCLVAIQTGMEVGMSPMQALRSVVVINGQPSWKGDAALGLVRASGLLEYLRTGFAGDGDERHCWVESMRKGDPDKHRTTFSIADAKRAKLWMRRGKGGQDTPWVTYPKRMMYYRALGFHLRDFYSDVLQGMAIVEEVQNYPRRHVSSQMIGQSEPPAPDPLLDQVADDAIDAEVTEVESEPEPQNQDQKDGDE